MKIKIFVAREIQYFEIGIFSFNSYVYYLTRGVIASTRAFNLPTCAFNLPTRAFNLVNRAFNLATRAFRLLTRKFELVTRGFELVNRVLLFHKIVMQYFLRSGVFFFILKIVHFWNIDQHKIIFPTVYSMMGFGKKKFFIKFGPLPEQPAQKKIVDIFFLKTYLLAF